MKYRLFLHKNYKEGHSSWISVDRHVISTLSMREREGVSEWERALTEVKSSPVQVPRSNAEVPKIHLDEVEEH